MLQDIENNRKTEIEAINYAIVKYGEEHGIPTPMNSFLTEAIRSLERTQNGNRDFISGILSSWTPTIDPVSLLAEIDAR